MKVVSLSALRTGHLYSPGNNPGTHFHYWLSPPQGHSASGRIMLMKDSNDTIGKRTHGRLHPYQIFSSDSHVISRPSHPPSPGMTSNLVAPTSDPAVLTDEPQGRDATP